MPDNFELFVEEHYRSAYLFALSLSGKHEDACDLTQQAFYIAQTKGAQVRDESKRKQWLFTCAATGVSAWPSQRRGAPGE
jgi:DNA-directed RNA polymerase specialized sigma24 family protein